MNAFLFIVGATALNIALVALMDVLVSKMPWRRKLGWSALILGLPLIGAVLYYLRGERPPARRARARRRSRGQGSQGLVQEDLPVPTSEPKG